MLRIAATCDTAFAHKQFRYRAGALHSANDEPAAVFAPASVFAPAALTFMRGAYIYSAIRSGAYSRKGRVEYLTQRSWYCAGELHRDYGPAVTGATYHHIWDHKITTSWWYKYDHGKQMAPDTNTCMGELTELSPRMRDFCACGCVKLVACDTINYHMTGGPYATVSPVRVYQTCTGSILEIGHAEPLDSSSVFELASYYRIGAAVEAGCHRPEYNISMLE
jgi:hypothetical protein